MAEVAASVSPPVTPSSAAGGYPGEGADKSASLRISSVAAPAAGHAQIRPPSTGKPARSRPTNAARAADRAALRQQQLEEYEKLCLELRLPANSGVLKALRPAEPGAYELRPHEYDFSTYYLGDRQFIALAGALAVDRKLVALRAPATGLMDAGMAALCEELKRCSCLECLDVSGNRFSMKGAEACLSLVKSAGRLVLLRAQDTVLDPDFCAKRGLRGEYAAVRIQIEGILAQRLEEASLPEVPLPQASQGRL